MQGNKRPDLISQINRLERRLFAKAQCWQGERGAPALDLVGYRASSRTLCTRLVGYSLAPAFSVLGLTAAGGLSSELSRPGTILLVACPAGSQQVAGFLVYRVQQLIVHLAYLAVVPEFRRRKVASQLVQVWEPRTSECSSRAWHTLYMFPHVSKALRPMQY